MTKKMAICNIQYTYEHYAGINVEKMAWRIHDYAEREFAEFHPMVSEPGNGVEMPDYVDVMLCKKDGCFFIEADIRRRAINLPLRSPLSRACQISKTIQGVLGESGILSESTRLQFQEHRTNQEVEDVWLLLLL